MPRRKKQLYAVVMILGGMAMAVDRVILPSGVTDPAVTMASPDRSLGGTQPGPDSCADHPLSIPELPFPRGIVPLDPGARIRDLFKPPAARSPAEPQGDPADNDGDRLEPQHTPGQQTSDMFMTRHHLQAVILNPRLKIAIVDDAWVRLGESVDGCTLIGIEGAKARFECFDGEAVLEVTVERASARD